MTPQASNPSRAPSPRPDKPGALYPIPHVCAHEPVIREGLEAAFEILRLLRADCAPNGLMWLRHNPEAASAIQRAYDLVTAEAPRLVGPCVAPQVIRAEATIEGLTTQVVKLTAAIRRAESTRDQAVAALERERKRQASENPEAPHKPAVVAMHQWANEYALCRRGAMVFWDRLGLERKQLCRDIVRDVEAAPAERL